MCTTIETAKGLSKYAIIAKQHSLRGAWLSSDGGWGRKCSCCCKCVFIYYPKKKYLPQRASDLAGCLLRVQGLFFLMS